MRTRDQTGASGWVQMSLPGCQGPHALGKGASLRARFIYKCMNLHSLVDKQVIPRVREKGETPLQGPPSAGFTWTQSPLQALFSLLPT